MRGLIERLRFARDHRWSPDHMSEYLDGELARPDRERIEHHTSECPECDALLRELRSMVAALGAIGGGGGEPVAAAVLAGVQRRLAEDGRDDGPV